MSNLDEALYMMKMKRFNLEAARLAEIEVKQLRKAIKDADVLLGCSLEFVEDMVGVASGARGLPEEIKAWRKENGGEEQ